MQAGPQGNGTGPADSTLHSLTSKVSGGTGGLLLPVVGGGWWATWGPSGRATETRAPADTGDPHSSFIVVLLQFRWVQTRHRFSPAPREGKLLGPPKREFCSK